MIKRIAVFLIFILLATGIFLAVSKKEKEYDFYFSSINMCEGIFDEPYEILLFITYDATLGLLTTKTKNGVYIPAQKVEMILMDESIAASDIAIIIHNHEELLRLSEGDLGFWHYFRQKGFQGSFGVYATKTKRLKIWKD